MPKSEKQTILVTGACGFVGRHLVKTLLEDGAFDVVACCRKPKNFPHKEERLSVVAADLLNPESFQAVFEEYKPARIVHLGALARFRQGEENPELAVRTNLFGSCRLIDLAVKHRVEAFVFLSSNLAREPKSVVGATKFLTEIYMQRQEQRATRLMALRLPNVPGSPGSVTRIFQKQIENNLPVTVTHPEMSRVFVNRNEASSFITYLMEEGKNKQVFVVTKPARKITDLAAEMICRSGKALDIKYIGMQPGEKLTEEPYPAQDLSVTPMDGLSLYTPKNSHPGETGRVLALLEKRLGDKGGKTMEELRKLFNKA
ncbi:MAG: polysaccharide biosynthesis protein [Bacteroidales bacterium]|nr:polysaccharide biosynthesis protein [Bacteroidales bacterium]